MRISCEHIAANSTPKPHVLTFLTADLLVYAFSDQVALYSLSQSLTLLNINGST